MPLNPGSNNWVNQLENSTVHFKKYPFLYWPGRDLARFFFLPALTLILAAFFTLGSRRLTLSHLSPLMHPRQVLEQHLLVIKIRLDFLCVESPDTSWPTLFLPRCFAADGKYCIENPTFPGNGIHFPTSISSNTTLKSRISRFRLERNVFCFMKVSTDTPLSAFSLLLFIIAGQSVYPRPNRLFNCWV